MISRPNTQRPVGVTKRYALLLLSFFLLSYILPLGAHNLIVPDETRYGEIPREMIAGGDWVVPHLNGARYFEKPALGYWVHAASILLCGETDFAVRLPSVLSVGLSALLIFVLVGRMCRNGPGEGGCAAFLAALVYLSCVEVFAVGTAAVLDSLFSFFLTAAITAFYFASETPRRSGREKLFLLLAGLSCGLAFLTKGFLAFAVPILAVIPYLIWQRRFADLLRMGWLPILTALLVALPWGIWIHLREPDFWRFFFWNEHIRRFTAHDAQHREPLWFFSLAAPGMFFPWTFLVPASVPGIKGRLKEHNSQGRLMKLSFCWLVLPFLFFSLSHGKLLTYILPCFPPFAIVMTLGLLHVLDKTERKRLVQWGIAVSAALFVVLLFVLLYAQLFGHDGLRLYSRPWKTVMAVCGLVFFISLCVLAYRNRGRDKIFAFGMAPLVLFFAIHFVLPDSANERKMPGPLLERNKQDIGDDVVVISDDATFTAVCWYLRRSDVYLLGSGSELGYGLSYGDAAGRLLDPESAADLIHRSRSTVLVGRAREVGRWRDALPEPVFEDGSGPSGYVLWRFRAAP